jgi:hypothetical protein
MLLFAVADRAKLSASVGLFCGLGNPQWYTGAEQFNWKKYLWKSIVKKAEGGNSHLYSWLCCGGLGDAVGICRFNLRDKKSSMA